MVYKISRWQIPDLLEWARRQLPDTFLICEKLSNHMKGNSPYLDVYVDQWPDPRAVVLISDNAGEEEQVQGVYGTSEEAVLSLLGDESVVDWTKDNTYFWILPDKVWRAVMTVVEDKKKSAVLYTGSHWKATPQDLKPVPVPEGMKISAVSEDYVSVVNENWGYANPGSALYIKNQINSYPSVMLTTDSGEHVGHMIGKDVGVLGNLYVHPKFRGNGFAKVIVSQLAQKYFDQGKDVYVDIRDTNVVSLNLHRSLGFKLVPDLKVGFLKYGCIRESM